jgi:hypothetical protein
MDKVWLVSPAGELREVEAREETLVPMLVAGWRQSPPPEEEERIDGESA